MSVYGGFWMYPDGTAQGLGHIEHAEVALKAMMKMAPDEFIHPDKLFDGLKAFTKSQIDEAKRKGASRQALDFLKKRGDPRLYAMKVWNWIRVAGDTMDVWKFDDKTLEIIQNSDYWQQQPNANDFDMVDIDEASTDERYSLSVKKLRNRSAEAGALKRFATGVGQFHENPGLEDDMHRYMYEINGEMKLFQPTREWEEIDGSGVAMNPPPTDAKMRSYLRVHEGGADSQSARLYIGLWTLNPPVEPVLFVDEGRRDFEARRAGPPGNYEWPVEAVIALIFELRRKQVLRAIEEGYAVPHPLGGDIGASFIAQHGIWQTRESLHAEPEPSVQVVILNTIQESANEFEQDMKELASEAAVQLIQWGVVVEMYSGGRLEDLYVYDGRTKKEKNEA